MSDALGGADFGELLSQMEQLQSSLAAINDASATTALEGTAGGGAMTVTVSGEFDFTSVHIDPSIVDADATDVLEDLVLAALRDAANKVQAARKEAVGQVMSSALGGLLGNEPLTSGDDPQDDETPER